MNLSEDLARRVEERLEENCQSRSEVLRYLLERYLETPSWSLAPSALSAPRSRARSADKQAESQRSREPKRPRRPAPSREQLAEAQKLATALDREIPDEALAYRSHCSDFIRKAKAVIDQREGQEPSPVEKPSGTTD